MNRPNILSLKAALYKSLVNHGEKVSIEKVLSRDGDQIADLFVGDSLALEVQCSRLSSNVWERDTCLSPSRLQVRWLLGEELWLNGRLTDLQRDFLYFTAKIGFHLWELDLKREEIRLKYLIYEDIFGKSII